MSKKVYVTLVGISAQAPGKKYVEVGKTVQLEKEPNNEFDTLAVAIKCQGELAGYVASKQKAVNTDSYKTIDNQEFQPMLPADTIEGIVVEEVEVQMARRLSKGFIIEVIIPEEKEEDENEFILVGSRSVNPGRGQLTDDFKKGQTCIITLKLEGDKVIAMYQGVRCGNVNNPSNKLKTYASSGVSAKLERQEKTSFVCSVIENATLDKLKEAEKSCEDLISHIVSSGIDTKKSIDQKLKYMRDNGVSEKTITGVLSTYVVYPEHVKGKVPEKPMTLYQDSGTGIVKKSIAYMVLSRNLLFEGDRGVGKNVLTETLAWVFNRPLYEFSLNSGHDNTSLLGGKTFAEVEDDSQEEKLNFSKSFLKFLRNSISLKAKNVEEEEAQNFSGVFTKLTTYFSGKKLTFEKSAIVEAFEYGGIIVFDEFNTSLGHVMSVFNSLLDDRRRITVPGYKTINAHPNFVAIATQNKDYQSTFENNEATIDRFVPIIFPTLRSIEDILFAKVSGVDARTVKTCQKVFEGMKNAIENGEINERCLTIRGFIDACLGTQQDIPLKEALIDNVANRAQDIDDRKSIRNMIDVQAL